MKKILLYISLGLILAFGYLTAPAQISIDSIVPAQACLGDFISIYGNGMSNVNSITIGGQTATILGSTSSQLITAIPNSLTISGNQGVNVTDGNTNASGSVNVEFMNPTFSYPSQVICTGPYIVFPNVIITPGGVFSAGAGLIIDSNTGKINLTNSFPGNYTVSYTLTTANGCQYSFSQSLTLIESNTAEMYFLVDEFCQNYQPDKPIILGGDSTGTFSYNFLGGTGPPQISWISAFAGLVSFQNSGLGFFEIIYSVPGPCPNVARDTIEIIPADVASFQYDTTAYCQGQDNPFPLIQGDTIGKFSEPTGSVVFVNDSTGEIDLSLSQTGGPYTISYLTSGPCPASTDFNLYIYPDSSYCLATSWDEIRDGSGLTLFPNPASSKVRVTLPDRLKSPGKLKILNLQGQVLLEEPVMKRMNAEIEVSSLPSGLFIVMIENTDVRFVGRLEIIQN